MFKKYLLYLHLHYDTEPSGLWKEIPESIMYMMCSRQFDFSLNNTYSTNRVKLILSNISLILNSPTALLQLFDQIHFFTYFMLETSAVIYSKYFLSDMLQVYKTDK